MHLPSTLEEPFAPTEDCIELLREHWDWDPDWFGDETYIYNKLVADYPMEDPGDLADAAASFASSRPKQFRRAVTALHALLFHPLLTTTDDHLFFEGLVNPEGWAQGFGVQTMPATGSLTLDETYYNREFLQNFYARVDRIEYPEEILSCPSYKMDWAALADAIIVSHCHLNSPFPNGGSWVEANFKYMIAPSFAHELGHAMGAPQHVNDRDPDFGGAYTLGATFAHAMLVGGALTRMPGKLAYLLDQPDIHESILYGDHCTIFFNRVDELDELNVDLDDCDNTYFDDVLLTEREDVTSVSGEDPCSTEAVGCDVATLQVSPPVAGVAEVIVPRWMFNTLSFLLDDFLLDAASSPTTVYVGTLTLSGFSIDWLHPDGFAAEFGIEEGDVVVAVNGIAASNLNAIERGIDDLIEEGYAEVVVVRGGSFVTIEYTLGD